jgi:hypothetical protein
MPEEGSRHGLQHARMHHARPRAQQESWGWNEFMHDASSSPAGESIANCATRGHVIIAVRSVRGS